MSNKKSLIYVAIPYSNPDPFQVELSFKLANQVTGELINEGKFPLSPISQSHPIALQCGLPGNWAFWQEYDELLISRCDELLVINTTGWKESIGVQAEIKYAQSLGIPISYYYDRH